jgi:pimeloyl-ACP methyl ester carboxylesterase
MKQKYLLVIFILVIGCNKSTDKTENVNQSSLKTGFINIEKTKLYFEEMGYGIPLLLIHGGLVDRRMWDEQFEEFSKHYRVIRYDARGHGNSDSASDTFSHHEDLNQLMEALNIKKAVLMGLSMGGYISIDFALSYPEKVISLILVSPGLTGYEFKSKVLEENNRLLFKAITDRNPDMIVEYFQRSWTDGPHRSPDQVDSTVRANVRLMARETVQKYNFRSLEKRLDPPAINRLPEIKIPTLTVVGKFDMPGIIEIVNMIERDIDGAKKVELDSVAHMVNMEKPKEFNNIVLEFLSKL